MVLGEPEDVKSFWPVTLHCQDMTGLLQVQLQAMAGEEGQLYANMEHVLA